MLQPVMGERSIAPAVQAPGGGAAAAPVGTIGPQVGIIVRNPQGGPVRGTIGPSLGTICAIAAADTITAPKDSHPLIDSSSR